MSIQQSSLGASTASARRRIVITVPGAPTGVTASAGDALATVSWTAPGNNGGSAIIDYTATSSPGGFLATSAASPCTVTGLTNGTAYTFTVKARNSVGSSAASAPSAAVTPVASGAPSTPAGYSTLAFFDDFPGTTLDTTKWNTYYAERGSSQQREDWGNGQRQYYKDANVTVSGGYCHLKYVRENTTSPATGHTYDWSGGMIDSHSKFTYRQGYAEARISIPCVGPGLWPAWWTWADTNDNTSGSGMGGELDMFEFYSDNHSSQYVTYQGGSSTTVSNADWTAGWHTYGTDWNGTNTRFYIDRSLVLTSSNASTYTGNMLLLVTAQVADDGSLTGTNRAPAPTGSTTSPQEILVDYVAVWH